MSRSPATQAVNSARIASATRTPEIITSPLSFSCSPGDFGGTGKRCRSIDVGKVALQQSRMTGAMKRRLLQSRNSCVIRRARRPEGLGGGAENSSPPKLPETDRGREAEEEDVEEDREWL